MIDFLEIRDADRNVIGLVDDAKSVIWGVSYYGMGDFEIYAPFTDNNWALLQAGNYVTRQNERNIGVIEHVNSMQSAIDGGMITASGRFAKCILAQRLIYILNGTSVSPVVSSGNVEEAARALVTSNIISAADAARNVDFVELGAISGLSAVIVDSSGNAAEKQTSYSILQEYTDAMLQEYGAAAYIGIDRETQQLQYIVFEGVDRSRDNTAGNEPLIFSQDFDNLLSTEYNYNTQEYKNAALIGGAGEGTARFMVTLGSETGIARREIFVDASDQSRTYKDGDTDIEYSETVYSQMLQTKARQELAAMIITETMAGEIDITNSGLQLGVDFYAGDIVTIQDIKINKYVNARILSVTEVQDDAGYTINIEFGE